MAAGLYGTFFSSGQIIAPIIGGAIFDQVGFRQTTDFMAFACIGYSIIFFIFNVGFTIFSKERAIREKRKALEEMLEEKHKHSLNNDSGDEEEEIEEFIKNKRKKWAKESEQQHPNQLSEIKELRETAIENSTIEINKGVFNLNNTYVNSNSNLSPNSEISRLTTEQKGSYYAQ